MFPILLNSPSFFFNSSFYFLFFPIFSLILHSISYYRRSPIQNQSAASLQSLNNRRIAIPLSLYHCCPPFPNVSISLATTSLKCQSHIDLRLRKSLNLKLKILQNLSFCTCIILTSTVFSFVATFIRMANI